MDGRVGVLNTMLAAHQMELPERAAQQVISDHLDITARLMRIGRQAAKSYVTDEVIAKLVDRLLSVDMDHTEANVVSVAGRRGKADRPPNTASPSLTVGPHQTPGRPSSSSSVSAPLHRSRTGS